VWRAAGLAVAMVAAGWASQVVLAGTTTTATARADVDAQHQHVVATEADNMKSVTLRPGDTLTVTLSGGWSRPQSSDTGVLSPEPAASPAFVCPPNAMCASPSPAPSTSETFTAGADGSATVTASRAPQCPKGRMCPMYVQVYRLNVTVGG
jgi:hypothetical protein